MLSDQIKEISMKKNQKEKSMKEESPAVSSNEAYLKAIRAIVDLNEKIADGEDNEDDLLWDEIGAMRKFLDPHQNKVIGRLMQSLFFVENKPLEIDEATPGSPLNFRA